jgi:glycosyltransferase involved in cell wall biosynthesis
MASGTVLIVDNRGGWKLQVNSCISGYLCDKLNDFVEAMKQLQSNNDLIKKMAKNAYDKLNADFSFNKSATSWERFFNGIEKRS